MDWRHDAACRAIPPETFFPLGEPGEDKAKAVCAGCPVRDRCLDWALAHEDFGVWGGLAEDERRALKRAAATARRLTPTARRLTA